MGQEGTRAKEFSHAVQPPPANMLTSLYRHGEAHQIKLLQQNLPFQPSFSPCCKQTPKPARSLCPAFLLTPAFPPLPHKRKEKTPKVNSARKNKMLNPQHPPCEQRWASRGPCTCENVRNPNVWTGFLCLPQTSKHDQHPNGGASCTAVSPLLCLDGVSLPARLFW